MGNGKSLIVGNSKATEVEAPVLIYPQTCGMHPEADPWEPYSRSIAVHDYHLLSETQELNAASRPN